MMNTDHVDEKQAVADQSDAHNSVPSARRSMSLDNYSRRFGGYTAEHRWVVLQKSIRKNEKALHKHPIEIQVRSVLMDSWIAINRDIEYDALTGILSAPERRILDSIKGLAQTGELLLEQLHHVNVVRRKEDQMPIREPGDITRVLEQYFVLEEPVPHLSEDPFAELLYPVLKGMGISTIGELKMRLDRDGVEPYCQEKFASFRKEFPIDGSFESFVLPRLLKSIQRHEVSEIFRSLGYHPYGALPSLMSLMNRTLTWVIDRKRNTIHADMEYPCLALVLCIYVWTERNENPAPGHSMWSGYHDHSILPDVLTELFRGQDLTEPGTSIMLTGLADVITEFRDEIMYRNALPTDANKVGMFGDRLVKQPLKLEQGINMFLRYSQNLKANSPGDMKETIRNAFAGEAQTICSRLFDWYHNRLSLHEAFRIAHTTNFSLTEIRESRAFWDLFAKNTLLQGFEDLIDRRGEAFQPWLDGLITKFEEIRGGKCRKWQPVMWKEDSTKTDDHKPRGHRKTEVALCILDCAELSEYHVRLRLSALGGMDIIFLQNFRFTLTEEEASILAFLPLWYYLGKLEVDAHSGLHLVTLVHNDLCGPVPTSKKPMSLGPLWKAKTEASSDNALVCDIRMHLGDSRPPICLRLPNYKPGAPIGMNLLPSEDDWELEERNIEYVKHENQPLEENQVETEVDQKEDEVVEGSEGEPEDWGYLQRIKGESEDGQQYWGNLKKAESESGSSQDTGGYLTWSKDGPKNRRSRGGSMKASKDALEDEHEVEDMFFWAAVSYNLAESGKRLLPSALIDGSQTNRAADIKVGNHHRVVLFKLKETLRDLV
ncbi:unnamed protein product [Periconia digitata]|uniref:Uncharacterized protein n=1 Tax=Periconia digitata TaxID=1303443 RepID=A0A9W4XWZ6_9PLEO|nr:unnamed protein product [Periconia digitata]